MYDTSDSKWTQYLYKAGIEIAYDNGMINRFHSEMDVTHSITKFLDGYHSVTLNMFNSELANLTKEQFMQVLTDEYEEGIISSALNKFLNDMFEAL